MRYSQEHKRETRQRIIASARRLFAAKGFAGTSIDEIMLDCQLTRGGFYAHFDSKRALYQEAVSGAAARARQRRKFEQRASAAQRNQDIDALLTGLLATARDAQLGQRSRLAFLATDAASDVPEVRAAYTAAFKALIDHVRQARGAMALDDEAGVLATAAMLIGALAVTTTTDDDELKRALLESCRAGARALLEQEAPDDPLLFFWAPPMARGH
jgi:TetR/AcrR family transcriptional repressor of nem operon